MMTTTESSLRSYFAAMGFLRTRFCLRIGARLHVIALHSDGIKTISQTVMRIDVTRNLDQGSHRLRLEILDLKTPSFVRVDDRRAGNDQRGGADAGQELPAIERISSILIH